MRRREITHFLKIPQEACTKKPQSSPPFFSPFFPTKHKDREMRIFQNSPIHSTLCNSNFSSDRTGGCRSLLIITLRD